MPHNGEPVVIRIGIHTGDCVSGLVGSKLHKFGLFGDTMNTASRMESTSLPGRIQISSSTHALLNEHQQTFFEATGGVEVKGKGQMETFLWIEDQHVQLLAANSLSLALEAFIGLDFRSNRGSAHEVPRCASVASLQALAQAAQDALMLLQSISSSIAKKPLAMNDRSRSLIQSLTLVPLQHLYKSVPGTSQRGNREDCD